MAFTKEQQKALDLSPKNRLVSAAAGSGKTAVLTERILQIVKTPKMESISTTFWSSPSPTPLPPR